MKRYLFLLLCLALISAAGCSPSQSGGDEPGTRAGAAANADADDGGAKKRLEPGGAVDVDLTVLSGTMVYAEIYNIMETPENYMGKTIKMNGLYAAGYSGETGLYYHYVVTDDATACCQQWFEFIWNGNHVYPNDYPEENAKVEVAGVFGSYEELGLTYYYLAVDELSVL